MILIFIRFSNGYMAFLFCVSYASVLRHTPMHITRFHTLVVIWGYETIKGRGICKYRIFVIVVPGTRPGSQILIFSSRMPDPGSKRHGSATKNLNIFNPKICFLVSSLKYEPGCFSWIPNPYPGSIQGSKKHRGLFLFCLSHPNLPVLLIYNYFLLSGSGPCFRLNSSTKTGKESSENSEKGTRYFFYVQLNYKGNVDHFQIKIF